MTISAVREAPRRSVDRNRSSFRASSSPSSSASPSSSPPASSSSSSDSTSSSTSSLCPIRRAPPAGALLADAFFDDFRPRDPFPFFFVVVIVVPDDAAPSSASESDPTGGEGPLGALVNNGAEARGTVPKVRAFVGASDENSDPIGLCVSAPQPKPLAGASREDDWALALPRSAPRR